MPKDLTLNPLHLFHRKQHQHPTASESGADSASQITLIQDKEKMKEKKHKTPPTGYNAGDMCFGTCCR
ncbi:hypothetical protein ASPWEDRAFT_546622 [Aspergillus wentii DTO 134E9]|uniref:Uncharacterized protein n=1 Tax=Aspergillus wentii DTO 134E9 TaxID=1073089 RepID=A0A1L9RFZ4_ASPWE|nr:uncharacterized protein ASPWEDRAFT_546622 [Aspergillus wentii DTO 134E9]KAI9925601.1 hypothetical protein MW887_005983 [Aspergillus wentii]OJJ33841.1 hypothetical protein ASPWEDRAFT_546622 [Aspergillus wentii DTO 134E9]